MDIKEKLIEDINAENKRVFMLDLVVNKELQAGCVGVSILLFVASVAFFVACFIDDAEDHIVIFLIATIVMFAFAVASFVYGIQWFASQAKGKKYIRDAIVVDAKIKAERWMSVLVTKGKYGPTELVAVPRISVTFDYNGQEITKYSGKTGEPDYDTEITPRQSVSQKKGYAGEWNLILKNKPLVMYNPKYDKVLFVLDESLFTDAKLN
ncbi:MAG: hypothetical protein IJV77_00080 [Clostridia bacterium]|nr:hypothetical protein [Clostridia bacterium]